MIKGEYFTAITAARHPNAMGNGTQSDGDIAASRALVDSEVDRIVTSDVFRASKRQQQCLRYIVSNMLIGNTAIHTLNFLTSLR
jgi:hypothetical protein